MKRRPPPLAPFFPPLPPAAPVGWAAADEDAEEEAPLPAAAPLAPLPPLTAGVD